MLGGEIFFPLPKLLYKYRFISLYYLYYYYYYYYFYLKLKPYIPRLANYLVFRL